MYDITEIYKTNETIENVHYCFICKFISDKKQFQSHLATKQHKAMQRIKDLFTKKKSSIH